jgi:hypothetical protein
MAKTLTLYDTGGTSQAIRYQAVHDSEDISQAIEDAGRALNHRGSNWEMERKPDSLYLTWRWESQQVIGEPRTTYRMEWSTCD